jgi:hypothetical protein
VSGDDPARWLARHRGGAAAADALAFFDRLPAVEPDAVVGRWRGAELPTGSRLDGLLTAHGWWGKEVVDADTVHPLLFHDRTGRPRPFDPALVPLSVLRTAPGVAHSRVLRRVFPGVRPLLSTDKPKARLRTMEHRGVVTAAMVYDALPIIDVFRRVTADQVLGLMDMRGLREPFFFLLDRETA